MGLARSLSVLGLGLVGLVGARASTQAYLHGTIVQWWTHKHSGRAEDDAGARRLGTFIKMRADFIAMLYCKVWRGRTSMWVCALGWSRAGGCAEWHTRHCLQLLNVAQELGGLDIHVRKVCSRVSVSVNVPL